MNSCYLYCNSEAAAFDNKKGFIIKDMPINKKTKDQRCSCNTTIELAFAKEFKSQREAEDFNEKYDLPCVIFERRDI